MQGLERIVLEQPFFAGLGPEFAAAIPAVRAICVSLPGTICFAKASRPTNST